MERQVMICDCHSLEHHVIFWYDEEDGRLYCEPHLTTHKNFFKRLWRGLRYAFGYKSRYGDWDSTIFKDEDLKKLLEYLQALSLRDVGGTLKFKHTFEAHSVEDIMKDRCNKYNFLDFNRF